MKPLVSRVIPSLSLLLVTACVDYSSEEEPALSASEDTDSTAELDTSDVSAELDTADSGDTGSAELESEESEMSECGLEVLSESPYAYEQCFEEGPGHFGACETCGYYGDVSYSDGAYDCITCADGWEIDVVFGDCTGYCVEAGTAVNSVIGSGCEPVSECVLGL